MLSYIGRLILLLPSINGNYAEESINKLLIRYSACPDHDFVSQMYEVIISKLQGTIGSGVSGHRLWLKININRLNNLLENGPLEQCQPLIASLNTKLETVSELTQNSYALDVIAAEIEYIFKTEVDLNKLSQLYHRSTAITSAITHPRVMGIIRECDATLHFYRKNYEKARVEFYECFKNYDEAGSVSKKKILKYLSLCSVLTESEVNPFESQETQTYSTLSEYENLTILVKCYEEQDLDGYLAIIERMHTQNDVLTEDNIFLQASTQILHNLKVKLLLSLLKAYRTIRFDSIIQKLRLADDEELEQLVIRMANSGTGADIRVDFCDRYIEVVEPEQFFPVSLDARTITNNFQILAAVGFTGPWSQQPPEQELAMDVDETSLDRSFNEQDEMTAEPEREPRHSVFYKLLLASRAINIDVAALSAIQEWYTYLRSAIPAKAHGLVSQKDQIFSKQQEDSATEHKAESNPIADANTNAGILGSSLNFEHVHDDEEEEEEPVKKLETLQKWAKQLSNDYKSLVEGR